MHRRSQGPSARTLAQHPPEQPPLPPARRLRSCPRPPPPPEAARQHPRQKQLRQQLRQHPHQKLRQQLQGQRGQRAHRGGQGRHHQYTPAALGGAARPPRPWRSQRPLRRSGRVRKSARLRCLPRAARVFAADATPGASDGPTERGPSQRRGETQRVRAAAAAGLLAALRAALPRRHASAVAPVVSGRPRAPCKISRAMAGATLLNGSRYDECPVPALAPLLIAQSGVAKGAQRPLRPSRQLARHGEGRPAALWPSHHQLARRGEGRPAALQPRPPARAPWRRASSGAAAEPPARATAADSPAAIASPTRMRAGPGPGMPRAGLRGAPPSATSRFARKQDRSVRGASRAQVPVQRES